MARSTSAPPTLSRETFHSLCDGNACPMWIVDARALAFLAVNDAAVRLYGYTREEFLSMTIETIRPPEDVPRLRAVLEGLPDRNYEGVWRHRKKDGGLIHVSITANKIDCEGRPALFAALRDVSEKVQAEQALKESEDRFNLIINSTSEVVWDWNLETNHTWCSDSLARTFGYSPKEVGDGPEWWAARIHPDDRTRVIAGFERALAAGESVWSDEYRFERADGTWAHVHDRGFVIRCKNGRPIRMLGATADVTERRTAEAALRESEERLRQMAEAIQDVFYLSDANTNEIIYVNPAFDRVWGIDRRQVQAVPRSWLDSVHPDDRERVVRSLAQWKPEGEVPEWNEEFRIIRPDGAVRWMWIRSYPIRDASGEIVRFAGVERDITERKNAEETVRSLLAITRDLNSTLDVDALLEALVKETLTLLDAEGGFAGLMTPRGLACATHFTRDGAEPFDVTCPPGRGLPGWVALHKTIYVTNDAERDAQILPEVRERFGVKQALCAPLLDSRGDIVGFIQLHNKRDGTGFGRPDEEKILLVSRAVSVAVQNALAYHRLQETAQALRRAEERYRGIIENAVEGIGQATLEGRLLTANPALARMLGYDSPEDLVASVADVRDLYVDPDVRERMQRMVDKEGVAEGVEVQVRRKDGTPIWILMNLRAVRDAQGTFLHYDGIVQDVTARKKTEEALREVSGLLLQSQNVERRRIARELHDSTAQSLAALAMNLSLVRKAAGRLSPAARKKLADSLDLAQQCCREVRTMSYLLHPPALDDADLWSALRWYAKGFTDRSGIHVDVALPSPHRAGRLPAEMETTLFRIVQESLANIHRHSGSRRARIRVAKGPARVTLVVRDEGRGLGRAIDHRSASPALMGVGIAGMRERVRLLGGDLRIDSTARGTAVKVTLPLPREH